MATNPMIVGMFESVQMRYRAMIARPPPTSSATMMIGIQFGGIMPPRVDFGVYRDEAATSRWDV